MKKDRKSNAAVCVESVVKMKNSEGSEEIHDGAIYCRVSSRRRGACNDHWRYNDLSSARRLWQRRKSAIARLRLINLFNYGDAKTRCNYFNLIFCAA